MRAASGAQIEFARGLAWSCERCLPASRLYLARPLRKRLPGNFPCSGVTRGSRTRWIGVAAACWAWRKLFFLSWWIRFAGQTYWRVMLRMEVSKFPWCSLSSAFWSLSRAPILSLFEFSTGKVSCRTLRVLHFHPEAEGIACTGSYRRCAQSYPLGYSPTGKAAWRQRGWFRYRRCSLQWSSKCRM